MEQRAWSQTEIEELKAKSAKVDQLETDLRALSEEIRSNLPPAEWSGMEHGARGVGLVDRIRLQPESSPTHVRKSPP